MVYERKSMLDEDKWNIHSSGYRTEKYENGKGDERENYKHEQYASNKEKGGYKAAEDYRKTDEDGEKKKEEESNEPSIEDSVNKEEKQKEEDEHGIFKITANEIGQGMREEEKEIKPKKKNKSIEEAIDKAIKEEKETIIVDQ